MIELDLFDKESISIRDSFLKFLNTKLLFDNKAYIIINRADFDFTETIIIEDYNFKKAHDYYMFLFNTKNLVNNEGDQIIEFGIIDIKNRKTKYKI